MKILILTQWFEPEPTSKGLLFARELVTRGHEVEVLTGFPNYPGGKLYPGYRIRPWVREQIDGVRILRVALYPSHSNSGFQRALNYVSFALSAALIGTALIREPDVVYVYHPPVTVGFAGAVIGFLRKTPFVYDIQDLWPDTVAASGMMSNPRALALLGKLCKFVYHRAAHITVLSRGFREKLVDRGIPADKIEVIYNWCDETALKHNCGPTTRLAVNRFCILFAGTMGHAQGLDSVLRAAHICRTTVPSAEFLFMGGGVDRGRLERMAGQMELDNVKFLPRQPMHAMGGILARADALLVHLKDDPLFRITIPSKTQAYLAAGKPILMAVHGDAADLVTRACSGVVCEPGNPHSIAAAVKELADTGNEQLAHMGRAGRAFYDSELSISIGVDKFERIFRMVAERPNHKPGLPQMYRGIKYAFDFAITLAGSIVVLPLSALIALSLWLTQEKVLFRQLRPGLHGKPFTLYKFCTMTNARDEDGDLLPDEQRITRLGAFVRNLSLDELPQFWNVIKGEMSLVGPRPLLMEYLTRYTQEEARRHDVMPGITGWAQVNGRNAISWESKFALDVWYVDHASFFLDLRILWITCLRVMRRSGISNLGHATMPQFMGKNVEN